MTRWALNRAGILNVYQYGDETLTFGGGRLLLRGVNGSGKSTAMNMLLPFLLEADTRRIDAAGEQAGVLRAWMLSGRDEQQPVGYLWIEFRRGDGPDHEFLVCGCGIRANRSTDRVTTWWFVTPRRPDIDFSFVEARTPLSIDALRAELGPNAVYTHEQRAGYRAEVRSLLYGGADLEQHMRLLHTVRNPRVGDRIEADLPTHLADALPQLSETALDDAAQPLEDLEEHRRNVEALTRTTAALDALDNLYGNYARSELHARADKSLEEVSHALECSRAEATLRKQQQSAESERVEAQSAIDRHDAAQRRLREEIDALKSREAYTAGAELADLRKHLASLQRQVGHADADAVESSRRRSEARLDVQHSATQARGDLDNVRDGLSDLSRFARVVGLTTRAPDTPTVPLHPAPDDVDIEVPATAFDSEFLSVDLTELRGAVHHRSGDVQSLRGELDAVDRAARVLNDADRAAQQASSDEEVARENYAQARATRAAVAEQWRYELQAWTGQLFEHQHLQGLDMTDAAILAAPDLADRRNEIRELLVAAVQQAIDHHTGAAASLEARRADEQRDVDELAARLAELMAQTLPNPPSAPWQRTDSGISFAECVDFDPALDATERARLEAAIEASGLLTAEVRDDGSLVVDGQLLARAGARVAHSLRSHLRVTLPEGIDDPTLADAVEQILDAISADEHDLDAIGVDTVVTVTGRFRVGVLHGQNTKPQAEHIGVSARRAALERSRSEAAARLADAQTTLGVTTSALEQQRRHVAHAVGLRESVPAVAALSDAVQRVELAAEGAAVASNRVTERKADLHRADRAHAGAVDAARRSASSFGLPADRAELDIVESTLRETTTCCDRVDAAVRIVARSIEHWAQQAALLQRSVDDEKQAAARRDEAHLERDSAATRLATLEDAIGLEFAEIIASIGVSERDLGATLAALEFARGAHLDAHGRVEGLNVKATQAVEQRISAEYQCIEALALLRRAMSVPGIIESAVSPAVSPSENDGDEIDAVFPSVHETPEGLRELAQLVRARVRPPDRTQTTADGMRQSLRQRRDALGAGWDAEDRQPDETLPLQIEVTGPLGRMPLHHAATGAHAQMRTMASLLTAKQHQALHNLLQGLIAKEVAEKLHAARELVALMNRRLDTVTTSHGIGVSLRWVRRDDLDHRLSGIIGLLAKRPDLRTADEDRELIDALSQRIADARNENPDAPYRQLIAEVLDYREWHQMSLILHRPGQNDERLGRRTALSEGEKKVVSYLPLFAAVAASCDALAESAPDAPRFVLLDDAFSKVSEDNHPKLFGLLVELDLDFIATSERLWGTHDTVPELAIVEVVRDADLGVIVLEHAHWDGLTRQYQP